MMLGSMIVSMILLFASRHVLSEYMERRRIATEENQAMLVRSLCMPPACSDHDRHGQRAAVEREHPAAWQYTVHTV